MSKSDASEKPLLISTSLSLSPHPLSWLVYQDIGVENKQ
jgi:hypothetical protein